MRSAWLSMLLGKTRSLILMLSGIVLVLLVWTLASNSISGETSLVPTPLKTFYTLVELATFRPFWSDLGVTLYRMIVGWAISVLIGIFAGIGIGISPSLSRMFGGIIDCSKYTPVAAFIPLSIIFFGIGETQKLAIIFLGVGPYMAVLVADAVRRTPITYIEGAQTLGASRFQIIRHVIFTYSAPQMWHAMRLALAIAWTYILIAEIVAADQGLGRFMIRAERFVNTDKILAAVIVIALIGWFSDFCFRRAYTRLFPWAVQTSQQRNSHG